MSLQSRQIGTWEFDLTTGQGHWDEACGKLFALPADRPVSCEEVRSRVHPEDRPALNCAMQAGFDPASGGTCQIEFRVIWPNGSIHRLLAKGRTLHAGNGDRHPARIAGMVLDLALIHPDETTLEQSRQRFQNLVETVNDWVWEVDQRGIYTYASPRIYDLLGYRPEEIIGKTPFTFMPEDERERVTDLFGRLVAMRQPFCAMENTNHHKDGRLVVLETSGVPFFDEQGTLLGYRGIDRDITERKRMEQELRAAKQAAEEASKSKSTFLANMSHELRTPMTVIIGAVDLLMESAEPGERKILEMVDNSALRLLGIIDDLLDISRIEAHKLKIEVHPFDLRNCVGQAVEMFVLPARKKGLSLHWEVDSQLPALMSGDAERIGQILVNLVGNAVKFTENGGEVGVNVAAVVNGVQFTVHDTGIGIPPAEMAHLFEPFTQGDSSLTRRYGGTGLGLAISKSLVAMMSGTIRAESEIGSGSTFTFILPLTSIAAQEATATPGQSATQARHLRTLLVEDDPSVAEVIGAILKRRGLDVTIAGNGQEAVDRLRQGGIDLVLMDLQMPRLDGLEATRMIRELEAGAGRRTSIFALTAHAHPKIQEKCLAAGMDGILTKPLRAEELTVAIESCR